MERVRHLLPEVPPEAEEAAEKARTWVDEVLEPKLKQGLENVASNIPESRLSSFLKQTIERLDGNEKDGPAEG
jgi:hypothetical protein